MDIDAALFTALADSVERIERAVVGDPSIGHVGLVSQLENERGNRRDGDRRIHDRYDQLDKRVVAVEKWRDRAVWTMTGIGAGSAMGGGGIVYLVTQLVG